MGRIEGPMSVVLFSIYKGIQFPRAYQVSNHLPIPPVVHDIFD